MSIIEEGSNIGWRYFLEFVVMFCVLSVRVSFEKALHIVETTSAIWCYVLYHICVSIIEEGSNIGWRQLLPLVVMIYFLSV